jgi:hypothetical protein
MSFGGLGLGTYVQHLINPGPNTNGLPVALDITEFQQWLNNELSNGEPEVRGARTSGWHKKFAGMRRDVAQAMIEIWGGFPPGRPVIAEMEIADRLKSKNLEVPKDLGRMMRHLKLTLEGDS